MDAKGSIKSAARVAARATGLPAEVEQLRTRLSELTGTLDRLVRLVEQQTALLKFLEQQTTAVDRGTQIALALLYRELWERGGRCAFGDVEFRNFSQNGEDGILRYIFSIIGTTSKKCVEMCAEDGRQCNTANLIINHGWAGLLFDGGEDNVKRGKAYYGSHPDTFIHPPKFVQAWVTAENADA